MCLACEQALHLGGIVKIRCMHERHMGGGMKVGGGVVFLSYWCASLAIEKFQLLKPWVDFQNKNLTSASISEK